MKNNPTRVLWVEDDTDDYILIRAELAEITNMTFALTWVTSYEVALEELEHNIYDVCLSDYRLGAQNGLDLLREMAERGYDVPLIMLTGQSDREIDMEAMQAGAADYLEKGKIEAALFERAIRYAIERHRLLMALRDLSLRDDLTNLYNRRGFLTLANQHLKLAQRQQQSFLIAFADLDRLKWINDVYGHAAGSQAIVDTSHILRATFRASDILARLGGDEFLALAMYCDGNEAELISNRLYENLRQHNARGRREYELSLSVGFAQFDAGNDSCIEDVIERADQAMYQHKQSRKMARGV